MPLVGSTITPIVVFLPLISITGVTGVFFRALAVTVGVALLTSLALALTWTPTLSHYFLRKRARTPRRDHDEACRRRLMRVYERVLRFTLEHPLVLVVFALLLIGGSYLCYKHTGSDLLPAMDEGGFIVDYIMPAGSSLEETNRVISHVEKILRATPEVESTSRRTGLQLGLAHGDRSQHRRHLREAEARPQAQRRGSDRRRARQDQRRPSPCWTWSSRSCCRT